MRETEILGRRVVVAGFRNAEIENVDAILEKARRLTKGCPVQFFDARLVGGFDHIYFAVLNALKATDAGVNISRDIAVEILLYASGQHQISKAIQLLGVKPGSSEIAVVVLAETQGKAAEALDTISTLIRGEQCDAVIELAEAKFQIIKEAFGITDMEIEATLRKSEKEALTNLLVERAALLVTQS